MYHQSSFSQSPYSILGVSQNASKEEIKKAYKEIALACHPDKLGNITDPIERENKIDMFKNATVAYETLTQNTHHSQDIHWDDGMDWNSVWDIFFKDGDETKEIIKDVFVDMATMFIQSKIYPKSYYAPSSNYSPKITHDITFKVTYREIMQNTKRKLRLILVDIDEPVFIDVYCGKFPLSVKEFTDDDDRDHEIIINMEIAKLEGYDHLISKSDSIDLITSIEIDLLDYINGCDKKIAYVDGNNIDIYVPPFQKDFVEIAKKGINGGTLLVNISIKIIDKGSWDVLSQENKVSMIRILDLLYKTI